MILVPLAALLPMHLRPVLASNNLINSSGKPVFVIFDMNFYDPAFVTSAARPYAGGFASHEVVEIMETGLVGLDIKGISVCGMLDYNDPGETSLNNLAECAGKLYAVAAYNIASEREL